MAGWWAEVFASITARAQAATASLVGEQPSSGVVTATVQRAVAALVGNQPFTAQIGATAKPAQAALTGAMTPEGSLALALRSALFSGSGVTGNLGQITVAAPPAQAALTAAHTQQGILTALPRPATAALAGTQPFTGTVAAQARQTAAAFSGKQTQQGAMAAIMQRATTALSGTHVADVGFDATGPGKAWSSGSTTWSHTIGAGATAILVGIHSSTATVTSVTVGGSAATRVGSALYLGNNGADALHLHVFALLNPPTGAQTVAVTAGGYCNGNSTSFTSVSTIGSLATNTGSGTVLTQSVSTATRNRIFHVFGAQAAGVFTSYSGTQRYNNYTAGVAYSVLVGDIAGGSVTLTATGGGSGFWGSAAVVLS